MTTHFFRYSRVLAAVVMLGWLGAAPAQAQPGIGLNPANIDPSVRPCADFFHYASGTWLKNNPIPPTDMNWGSWDELVKLNNATQRAILEELAQQAATAPKGSNAQKVGDFYASAMDSAAIERAGIKYLQPHLDRIMALKSVADEQRFFGDPKAHAGSAWFYCWVEPDEKNATQYAVRLYQGGLSLASRDYYLLDDARAKAIRAAYHAYQVALFRLLGDDPATAEKNAATVTRLETRLARASRSRTDLRDPSANYHKMTVAVAAAAFPGLGLPQLLRGQGLGAAREVIVSQPEFLQEVSTMVQQEPMADQRQYLRWHLVSSLTSALPKAYGEEALRLRQVTNGTTRQQPRWKRMLEATDDNLGEAFGQLYVEKAFPPAAKALAKQLIDNLRAAYAERIAATDWMSAATKQQALAKLRAITVKLGYPDKWKDYASLRISRESYLNNLLAAQEWANRDNLAHFGQPIDRTAWNITPPTVNAYYRASLNDIMLPAGMLQPPLFNPEADDAVNYGGIGALIGHEMTHGFDDTGRQFDAQGNLRDWWTKEDADKFTAKAKSVSQQYSKFSPLDSVYVNGDLTLGENLADLGGVTIAYQAFQKTQQAKAGKSLDGFTPNQRFFLAYAQLWRRHERPEAARENILTDPHAPNQFRTNGPLMNMPEFYQAFGCQPGDPMVRPAAAQSRIW